MSDFARPSPRDPPDQQVADPSAGTAAVGATEKSDPAWVSALPLRLREGLSGRHGLHAILANSGWLMLDRMLRLLLALIVGAWVARHLGPARYGQLAYVVALLAFFNAFANLGLDGIVVRDLAQDGRAAPSILGTTLYLRLVAGLGCWAFAVGLTTILRRGDTEALTMIGILGAGMVLQSSDVVDLWFQSQTRSRLTVLCRAVAYCSASLVKVGLILADAPLWMFALALLGDTLLASVALIYAYRKSSAADRWQWNSVLARQLLLEGWPFMLAGLSVVIYMRIDQLLLLELSDEHQLGLYSAILPFSQVWHMIPMTVCSSVFPRLSTLRRDDPVQYTRRLQQLFTAMAWSGLIVSMVTGLFAPWLVGTLLGPGFAEAAGVLRWHAFTNIFAFLGVAQSVTIINDRKSHISLVKTLSGAATSVAMNYFLVPHWGAIGSAWAAVGSYFVAAIITNIFVAPVAFSMQLTAIWPFHVRRA